MAEWKFVVYIVVGLLGIIAASSLGYAAESTRIKVSDVTITVFGICNYPSSPANILGYVAAMLTLNAQIIISVVTCCAYFRKDTSNTVQPSDEIVHFAISWVAFLIGIYLLLAAAILSSRQEYVDATGLCYTVRPGLFGAGGSLALVACVLGLCAYSASTKDPPQAALPMSVPHQSGIAMGIPLVANPSAYMNPGPSHNNMFKAQNA